MDFLDKMSSSFKKEFKAYQTSIDYTDRMRDDVGGVFRQVLIPKDVFDNFYCRYKSVGRVKMMKDVMDRLMLGELISEIDWRMLGLEMSLGWDHYFMYTCNRNNYILCFKQYQKHNSLGHNRTRSM